MSNHNLCIKGVYESLDISVRDKPTISLTLLDVDKSVEFPVFKTEYTGTNVILDVMVDGKSFVRILCKAKPWKFVIDSSVKFVFKADSITISPITDSSKSKFPSPFDILSFTEIFGQVCELRINTKPTSSEISLIMDPMQTKLATFKSKSTESDSK